MRLALTDNPRMYAVVVVVVLVGCAGGNLPSTGPNAITPAVSSAQFSDAGSALAQLTSTSAVTRTALSRHTSVGSPSWMRTSNPDARSVGLYLTLAYNDQAIGYQGHDKNNNGPICSMSTGVYPINVAADKLGNVYVVNNGYPSSPSSISTYGPNCGTQTGNVNDPYGTGGYIAISGGKWYVGNRSGSGNNSGNIAVCSASGCTEDLTAKPPGIVELVAVAVDSQGNVYANGYPGAGSGGSTLWEWRHGKMPSRIVGQNLPSFSDIAFDNHDNLIGWNGFPALLVYTGCTVGRCRVHGPFPLHGKPEEFAFNAKKTKLFITDYQGNGSQGDSVDVYDYHGLKGITYLYSITAGLNGNQGIFGIAVLPSPQ